MVIKEYKSWLGSLINDDGSACTIEGIDRIKYMTDEFLKINRDYLKTLNYKGKNAFLYAGGPAIHHSEGRNVRGSELYGDMPIKSQLGFSMFKVARNIPMEFEYASVNANTCASSMHCIYEAYQLIHKEGYDNVVVYAADLVEASQLGMFKQFTIDIMCGDGLGILVLSKEGEGIATVDEVSWLWHKDPSPMTVTVEGYTKLIKSLDTSKASCVKPHGTNTGRNNISEDGAIEACGLGELATYRYKQTIGHTQGASTAVEVCLLLDEMPCEQQALVLASGMGGFYGGCTVTKNRDA